MLACSIGVFRPRLGVCGGCDITVLIYVCASREDIQAAMRRYNFYLCVKCDRPYFGGVAACGAVEEASAGAAGGAGDANGAHANQPRRGMGGSDEVLMCGSCSAKASGMAAASCARHGEQYIEFKCRFCCSIATFFCFGHTHFCEKCHKKVFEGVTRMGLAARI